MMPHEKDRILELFADESRWCRTSEANDAQGQPVQFDSPTAVAWDVAGALCQLFGWKRACVLFEQIEHHVTGHKRRFQYDHDPVLEAMIALQNFNDKEGQTFEAVLAKLRTMRTWQGRTAEVEHLGKEEIVPLTEML